MAIQIGSFQIISRQSYFFIHINHSHLQRYVETPPCISSQRKHFFKFTTLLLLWINKGFVGWRNERGQESKQSIPESPQTYNINNANFKIELEYYANILMSDCITFTVCKGFRLY